MYLHVPRKLIMINGQGGADLCHLLQHDFESTSNPYYNFKSVESFSFPAPSNHETFSDKCFNADKTQTTFLRYGILPLKWIHKYTQEKPSMIIFIFDLNHNHINDVIDDFKIKYGLIDPYIRKNKIKTVLILRSNAVRLEEEKSLFKNTFEQASKHIFTSRSPNFEDIQKELGAYIKLHCIKFYLNKISKYKDNLTMGSDSFLRFREYYLRNNIKIGFFNLFSQEKKKAIKYFEKGQELCLNLIDHYHKFVSSNIKDSQTANVSNLFYYMQKMEEVRLISNLCFVWTVFLRLREKELTSMAQVYTLLQEKLVVFSRYQVWRKTPFAHFENLWKCNLLYVFLSLFKRLGHAEDVPTQLIFMSCIRNMLEMLTDFFERGQNEIKYGITTLDLFSYGLVLDKETYNISNQKFQSLNETVSHDHWNYHHDLIHYKTHQMLASELIKYDEHFKRLFNVVIVSFIGFSKFMSINKTESIHFFPELPVFNHFPHAKAFVVELIFKENPDKQETFIRRVLEEEPDTEASIVDMVLSAKDAGCVLIELDTQDTEVLRVFEKSEARQFEPINLDLLMEIKKKGNFALFDSIQLKFNNHFYDSRFELTPANFVRKDDKNFVQLKTFLSYFVKHVEDNQTLALSSIQLNRGSSLSVSLPVKFLENMKKNLNLRLVQASPFVFSCDMDNSLILNRELRAFTFRFTPASDLGRLDFQISNLSLSIAPVPKEYLKSFKIYQRLKSANPLVKKKTFPKTEALKKKEKKAAPKETEVQDEETEPAEERLSYRPERISTDNLGIDPDVLLEEEEQPEKEENATLAVTNANDEEIMLSESENVPVDESVPESSEANLSMVRQPSLGFDYKTYRNQNFKLLFNYKHARFYETSISDLLTSERELVLYFKIVLNSESPIEFNTQLNYVMVSKDKKIVVKENKSQRIALRVKLPFSLTNSINTLERELVVRDAQPAARKNLRVQIGTKNLLNYYLRSNFASIIVNRFFFTPGARTKIFTEITSTETEQLLRNNEGTSFSLVFSVFEPL